MATNSVKVQRKKNPSGKSIVDISDDFVEKDSPHPSMNGLEKLLSNYKLKPINNVTAGYNKIASQIYRKSVRAGFQFNLMIVGCSGLGKTTFLNTLFHTQFPENRQTSSVTENTFKLIENDVELKLKIVESPQFGGKINNSDCWKKIDDYLKNCFKKQMKNESKSSRKQSETETDHLVHACLYFIEPKGENCCLRDLDLEFLRKIHNKVNVIPIIAKADSMTPAELEISKSNLMAELNLHGINCFKFIVPEESGWKPETNSIKLPDRKFTQSLLERFPFAVVGGNEIIINDKEQILVRSYPWGKVEVDNLSHSDTSAVRILMLSTHTQDLISNTHNVIYEDYRIHTMRDLCNTLGISAENQHHPSLYLEKYVRTLNLKLSKKVTEMEAGFQDLVNKREEALQKKAKELEEEAESLASELNVSLFEFDKFFTRFIADKTQWDCDNIEYHETYGTLRISRNGRLKPISKLRK